MNIKNVRKISLITLGYLLPVVAWAQAPGTETTPGPHTETTPGLSSKLPNPLGDNITNIYDFVVYVLNNIVLPIGSVVVVIMIIYSGFLFVTARGNESKLESAKHILLYVVIGTAVLLGAVVIASAIKGTIQQIAPNLPL